MATMRRASMRAVGTDLGLGPVSASLPKLADLLRLVPRGDHHVEHR